MITSLFCLPKDLKWQANVSNCFIAVLTLLAGSVELTLWKARVLSSEKSVFTGLTIVVTLNSKFWSATAKRVSTSTSSLGQRKASCDIAVIICPYTMSINMVKRWIELVGSSKTGGGDPYLSWRFLILSIKKKKTLSCKSYKPLTMTPNRVIGRCILSFAYTNARLFFVPGRATQQSFIRGGSAPRSKPLPFYISFLRQKVPLSCTYGASFTKLFIWESP